MSLSIKSFVAPLLTLSFLFLGIATVSANTLPEGCTTTSLFSPLTGTKCNSGITPVDTIDTIGGTTSNSSSCLFLTNNFQYGAQDSQVDGEVSDLQSFLKDSNYLTGNTSGSFGYNTRNAVKVFQGVTISNIQESSIDSIIISSAADRHTLTTSGFRLTNSGYVGMYTRAKIAYVSCLNGNTNPPTATPPTITTTSLPNATVGTVYTSSIVSTGGTGTRDWTTTGTVPTGLYLNKVNYAQGQNGGTGSQPEVISFVGTPTNAGTYTFTVTVTIGSKKASRQFSLVVNSTPLAMCDYASPPTGCTYIQGSNYNATTNCGMVLSCMAAMSKLPPTGITTYGDATTNNADASIASDNGAFPRQDARYARPFDYIKIANDGSTLPSTAVLGTGPKDWACTKDNITGLIWEVKTTSGLRNKDNTYTWYQNNIGTESKGSCQTSGRCDTDKFAQDLNQTSLCGFSDWRMPGVKELEGIANFGKNNPSIDSTYFSNTQSGAYWSQNKYNQNINLAWIVGFRVGIASYLMTDTPLYVRLVRGALEKSVYTLVTLPNGDTAVTDSKNGLMWKREHEMVDPSQPDDWNTLVNALTWQDALKRAVNDRTGGYSDWRLPNIKELRSLVDENRDTPALDPIFMKPPHLSWFWSSSPYMGDPTQQDWSMPVYFGLGGGQSVLRNFTQYARLVRDMK